MKQVLKHNELSPSLACALGVVAILVITTILSALIGLIAFGGILFGGILAGFDMVLILLCVFSALLLGVKLIDCFQPKHWVWNICSLVGNTLWFLFTVVILSKVFTVDGVLTLQEISVWVVLFLGTAPWVVLRTAWFFPKVRKRYEEYILELRSGVGGKTTEGEE